MYRNNINDCYKKMEEIKEEITSIFNKTSIDEEGNHPAIKNTKYKRAVFNFENGRADLVCFDVDKQTNKTDRLTISLISKEFGYFLTNEHMINRLKKKFSINNNIKKFFIFTILSFLHMLCYNRILFWWKNIFGNV